MFNHVWNCPIINLWMLKLDSLKAAYNMKSLVNNKNEEIIAIEEWRNNSDWKGLPFSICWKISDYFKSGCFRNERLLIFHTPLLFNYTNFDRIKSFQARSISIYYSSLSISLSILQQVYRYLSLRIAQPLHKNKLHQIEKATKASQE